VEQRLEELPAVKVQVAAVVPEDIEQTFQVLLQAVNQ
jgi:hypothetical protein